MDLNPKDLACFWAKVDKNGPNGCWVWTGTIATHCGGYGIFDRRRNGVRIARRVHRIAYELLVGPIPENQLLRHKCDNPPCLNPDHLVPGTPRDNSQDMVQRGRHWTQVRPELIPRGVDHWTVKRGVASLPRGELHHNAKLTAEQVRVIHEAYEQGQDSQRGLAIQFGVSQGTIWQIINGNYWKEAPCS